MSDEGDYVKLISPQDYRVYSVPRTQRDAYQKAGYVAPQEDIKTDEIHQQFNGWSGLGKSFGYSFIKGVPFAKTAIAGLSTKEQAKAWQESFDAAAREHPYLDLAGQTVGTLGAGAAAVAAATAGLGALGVGGAAAGVAAAGAAEAGTIGAEAAGALGGAGALAEGAGAAGAAATGAEGAAVGAEGLGAQIAAKAGQGYNAAVAETLGAKTVGAAIVKGATVSAGLGQIARIDDAALRHAADPEGQEKLVFDANATILDAALGAALPVAGAGVAKSLGWIGRKVGTQGMKVMQNALTKADAMDSVERQGRMGDVRAKLEEVIKTGRKNPSEYVKNRVAIAGHDLEQLKAYTNGATLAEKDTAALKQKIRDTLGPTDAQYSRMAKFLDKKKKTWDIKDMQDVNEVLYKGVNFPEKDLRPEANAAYIKAAEAVKQGMFKVASQSDLTQGQMQAQKFATALKEYSDWQITHSVLKRGEKSGGLQQVIQNVASGAATGFAAGGLFNAFGGALPAAAGGAGYGAMKSVNAAHYGQAMQILGNVFKGVDKRLTTAVEAGLYGAPALLHKGNPLQSYQDVASKVSAARQDPQQSFTNLRTALTKQDVPDDMADNIALAQHTQVQWLASKIPGRSNAPDVVSRGQGDPTQQRRFVGQVHSIQDPTYALAYPTQSNLEVLKQFYPNVLHNAQQAILSQVQKNPNLPTASKQWASRVLGRPMGNLSSPTFSSMLQTARQQAAQALGQAQAQAKPSRGPKAQGANQQTRFDELQGGE